MRGNMWAFFALRRSTCEYALGRICSGENMLWGEEENWQKRREFSKFNLLWGEYALGRRRKLAKKERI